MALDEPKPSERNPLFCRICHAPRQVSEETGDVTGCGQHIRNIALPVPPLAKAGAYRRSPPSSLWEAVKKYHYARAVSSRPACHGRVNRMRGSLWRSRHRAALFAAQPHGGCTCNIVYSIVKVRRGHYVPSIIRTFSYRKSGQLPNFFRKHSIFSSPRRMLSPMLSLLTPSALAIFALLMFRKKCA